MTAHDQMMLNQSPSQNYMPLPRIPKTVRNSSNVQVNSKDFSKENHKLNKNLDTVPESDATSLLKTPHERDKNDTDFKLED